MRIYTIPKKLIYDNWNGYKPICFSWGTNSNVDCEPGDITYNMEYSTYIINTWDNTEEDEDVLKPVDVKIRVIPPRVFYDSVLPDLISDPPNFTPNEDTIKDFRPVNNVGDDVTDKKNPIEKDPRNGALGYTQGDGIGYFSQLTECVYPGEIITVNDEDVSCVSSAFYPYVFDEVPYLFQPTYDIDYRGNLMGITDGTKGETRTDNVLTSYTQVPSTEQLKNITLSTDYIRQREFSTVSFAWVGEQDIESGITVQRGYEPNTVEETQTSAPNFVNFWITPTSQLIGNGILGEEDYIDMSDDSWSNDIYLGTGMGYKWCVARWGDEDDINESDIDTIILQELQGFETSPSTYNQALSFDRYNWTNVKDDSGLGIQSHQYQAEGPKTIKAFVFSYIKNTDQSDTFNRIFDANDIVPFQTIQWKLVTIRILLNQSSALVEDFSELGGGDIESSVNLN